MTKYQIRRLDCGGGLPDSSNPTHVAIEISTLFRQTMANLYLSGDPNYGELYEFVTWLNEPDGLQGNDSSENDDDLFELPDIAGFTVWDGNMEDWDIQISLEPVVKLRAGVKHTYGRDVWTPDWC